MSTSSFNRPLTSFTRINNVKEHSPISLINHKIIKKNLELFIWQNEKSPLLLIPKYLDYSEDIRGLWGILQAGIKQLLWAKCLMLDRAWFTPLIVAKPSLHHMYSNLSKSRGTNMFDCCGHVVSLSRRFVVQAKWRANVDGKVPPSNQRLHCRSRLSRVLFTRQIQ